MLIQELLPVHLRKVRCLSFFASTEKEQSTNCVWMSQRRLNFRDGSLARCSMRALQRLRDKINKISRDGEKKSAIERSRSCFQLKIARSCAQTHHALKPSYSSAVVSCPRRPRSVTAADRRPFFVPAPPKLLARPPAAGLQFLHNNHSRNHVEQKALSSAHSSLCIMCAHCRLLHFFGNHMRAANFPLYWLNLIVSARDCCSPELCDFWFRTANHISDLGIQGKTCLNFLNCQF